MTGLLAQAKALLESVVQKVLLGPRFHGLLFSHRLLDDLLHHFLSHDFSVSCIRQALQVQQHILMSEGFFSFWLPREVMHCDSPCRGQHQEALLASDPTIAS